MPCFPCGGPPSETKLLARCYPPSQGLEKSETAIRPSKQELSDLVSALRDRPGQIPRVVGELEKKVQKSTGKTSGDNTHRASLLVSLSILRSLTSEFKAEIPSFAKPLIRIVNLSLESAQKSSPVDLECLTRATSVFIAFSSHSGGTPVITDIQTFSTYLLVLRKLAKIATYTPKPTSEKPRVDTDLLNRSRAIGLAGLYASLTSPTLLGESVSASDFGKQIKIILPALLATIRDVEIYTLKTESDRIDRDLSGNQRARSLRNSAMDEKAPDSTAVLHLALKSLYDLIGQCQTTQLSAVVDAIFEYFDKEGGWQNVELCCWLAERITSGAMLQYRYVVPTRLVELIHGMGDIQPGHKQTTILAMITTVINSDISLVGLGVIYILDSLVGLTIRRIRCSHEDALLTPLVQCIASLATHIYYPDQVNEIVEEIAYRLPDIPSSDASRQHIVRILVNCIIGVMETAQRGDELEANRLSATTPKPSPSKGKGPQLYAEPVFTKRVSKRRAPISPDIWQETLPILCESTYAVRGAYARALILYIQQELPREESGQADIIDMSAFRFCNALFATIYTLAMSSCLGTGSPPPSKDGTPRTQSPKAGNTPLPPTVTEPTPSPTPKPSTPVEGKDSLAEPKTKERSDSKPEKGVSFNVTEPTPLDTPTGTGTGTATPPRKNSRSARRVSLPLNRLNSFGPIESFDNVATPYDFASILKVLEEVFGAVPLAATLAGVPMLLALDADAGNELIRRPGDGRSGSWVLERKRAIREAIAFTWRRIGKQWDITQIEDLANKTLDSMPEPWLVPTYQPLSESSILPPPDLTCTFIPHEIEGESSSASRPLLDRENILSALSTSRSIQSRSGKEEDSLIRRLGASWSVENALKNSMDKSSGLLMDEGGLHTSLSTSSFLRPQSRMIDVNDLRLALDGRGSLSNNNSRAPSLRSSSFRSPTQSHSHLQLSALRDREGSGETSRTPSPNRPRSRLGAGAGQGHGDMKDVLKDIFSKHKTMAQSRAVNGQGQGSGVANGQEGHTGKATQGELTTNGDAVKAH